MPAFGKTRRIAVPLLMQASQLGSFLAVDPARGFLHTSNSKSQEFTQTADRIVRRRIQTVLGKE